MRAAGGPMSGPSKQNGRGCMTAYLSFRGLWRAAVPAAILMILATAAYAMRVSPMVVEMSSTGSDAVARIEVQNLLQARLPFETRITRIQFNNDGTITEIPADEDFLIFPPQGILPVNSRQVIRLQWVGGADIPASQAYYLSVRQLPVQLDPGDENSAAAQVQMVYNMKPLIVVSPPRAAPNAEVTSVRRIEVQPEAEEGQPQPDPVPGIEVVVRNTGNRHVMMAGLRWLVEGTGTDGRPLRIGIEPQELNRVIGTGYVPPLDGTRTFRIPLLAEFGEGPITVRFLTQ